MKALVVSCGTGGGHNAAGRAVQENLVSHDEECAFIELYDFKSTGVSNRVNNAYIFSTRHPAIFKNLYKLGMFVSKHQITKSPVYAFNTMNRADLAGYLQGNGIDVVVTPHIFAADTLTSIKHHGDLEALTVGVGTDYTCIPFWEESELDCYILPHPDCCTEYIERGIPAEKLFPLGIPVASRYSDPIDELTKIATHEVICKRHGFDPASKAPLFVVMTGSMGFGRIDKLVEAIVKGGNANVIVCCGSNLKLQTQLAEEYSFNRRVVPIGYIRDDSVYMDACDVFFTKPGGLTSTEAAVRNIPFVHTDPIPGCETVNREFFVTRGMSMTGETVEEQARAAYTLAGDAEVRSAMLAAQRREMNPHAADDIRVLIEGELARRGRCTAR